MNSGIEISQSDGRPMYLQIMEQVRRRIAVGDWPSGQELPSIRALAVELKVSVITVKRAYLELEHAGVIVTRQGRGSFVTDGADLGESLKLQELDKSLEDAVDTAWLLGLSDRELEARLRDVQRRRKKKAS